MVAGDDASPQEPLENAGEGDAWEKERDGLQVRGNKRRREGGGKRIASVGPALSLIASSLPPLKIHRENFVPPSPKDTLYTGHALKLMAALFDYIAL